MNLNNFNDSKPSFRAAAVSLLAACLILGEALQNSVHPVCPFLDSNENFFDYVEDITALLRNGQAIPSAVCVYNPTVLHFQDDLYIWSARIYSLKNPRIACNADPAVPRPLLAFDYGQGNHTFLLAVTQSKWISRGNITHQLVGHAKFDIALEDPRLFKDAAGTVRVSMCKPKGAMITVSEVKVFCDYGTAAAATSNPRCQVWLGATKILWYLNSLKREKNWVPHNGTTRMTYPVFRTFSPHSVFDWRSYEVPEVKRAFDSVAPSEPFFQLMNDTYHGYIEFAGSTPAILHEDGKSYIAIGHIRAHPFCFHDIKNGSIDLTCNRFVAIPEAQREMPRHFTYWYEDGYAYFHHVVEYGMFFYRFSAVDPFMITHISHAFYPCTFFHNGIVYPAGLDRIGPHGDYLIAYGESDRFARVATVSSQKLNRLLVPIEEMRQRVGEYSLCTLPCPNPPHQAGCLLRG